MTNTVTPFSADLLWTLSLGDPRVSGMKFGPWEIRFEDDAILLDGAPIEVRSWGHAGSLVTARDHAERWLAILRQEAERRRDLRLQAFPDPLA